MRAIFPSSLAQTELMRLTIQRRQTELARAEIEASSGRHSDMGRALRVELASAFDMRTVGAELEALKQTGDSAAVRLGQTQSALGAIAELADGFFASLLTARQSGGDRGLLIDDARSRLASLTQLLGASSDGIYLFSGQRSDVAPLGDYLKEPVASPRTVVQAAFSAAFPGSISDISPADMTAYLDTTFAGLFSDASWSSLFSSAHDSALVSRIGRNDVVETSVTANEPSIRAIYQALVATIDTGIDDLSADAFDAFADKVSALAGGGSSEIARLQSRVGIVQERLAKASERISYERSVIEQRVDKLEGVDAFEVAVRLNSTADALEASYAVTARLQGFSLLKYL